MQARQLRRARGSHRSFDRPRPYLPSTGPLMSGLSSYVFPRQAPLMCGAVLRQAPSYVRCLALPSTGPAYVWCGAYVRCSALPLMRGAVPGLTAYVRCFTSTDPAYVRYPALPLMCSARGVLLCLRAVLCFDRARGASTAPAYLLCALRCSALLRQPPALLRHPPALLCPGVLCLLRHPPGVLCLLTCLLTCLRVFYTY